MPLDTVQSAAQQHFALKHSCLSCGVRSTGADSMIVRLALGAHSKLVGAALDMGLPHGEAAFKQHVTLQVTSLVHMPCCPG